MKEVALLILLTLSPGLLYYLLLYVVSPLVYTDTQSKYIMEGETKQWINVYSLVLSSVDSLFPWL